MTTEGKVEVLLTGGPTDLPPTARTLRIRHGEKKVKIVHRGGYEHFECDPGPASVAATPVVYRWTTRTRIAE